VLLHAVASLDSGEGGVPRSAAALVARMRQLGNEALIMPVEESRFSLEMSGGLTVTPDRDMPPGNRYDRRGTLLRLDTLASAFTIDLVHDHGIWLPMHNAIAAWCRRREVPRVVSVRGMLNPWARRHHAGRKWLAWQAYQRSDLSTADALHATCEAEYGIIRELGLRQPVILLPNGVEAPPSVSATQRSDRRTALFLSRLNPSKGVEMLLRAWRDVAPAGWKLVIAGNGSDDYVRAISASIARLGLADVVSLHGAVDDSAKWDLYRAADLFILPSLSENFGTVVGEALAVGLPVITTQATPWNWLPARQAGWWVATDTGGLAVAVRAATSLPAITLRKMGLRGQEMAGRLFDWTAIAREFIAAYAWLLGRGPTPACVRF
jgi:glycosyltransferase involved in cell wall biosynthesis